MKRILVLLLSLMMILSLVPAVAEDEVVDIYWQYPTPGDYKEEGLREVEDALNAMMIPEIGVRVHFMTSGLGTAQQEAVLMVSAGEQLDIMLNFVTPLGPIISSGLIVPMDDLLEQYGQDCLRVCGEAMHKMDYAGQCWGVPPTDLQCLARRYLIRKDMVEKYNLDVDPDPDATGRIYSLDEIEAMFETVKAGEGDNFYMTTVWNSGTTPMNDATAVYDALGMGLKAGVLMLGEDFKTSEIVNYYATEEYKGLVERAYRWAQKGYIAADAAVNTTAPEALVAGGNYLGDFSNSGPIWPQEYGKTVGYEVYSLPLYEPYLIISGGAGAGWCIPITAVDPVKSMQAINFIYKHPEAAWLVQYGVEGSSYEVVEQTEYGPVIRFLGATEELPYYNPYGLWGDRLAWPILEGQDPAKNQILRDFDAAVPQSRFSPALGYSFQTDEVEDQLSVITSVIEQYAPSLNAGAVDPAVVLPEFLKALEDAGINEVIAQNQSQLNAFLGK